MEKIKRCRQCLSVPILKYTKYCAFMFCKCSMMTQRKINLLKNEIVPDKKLKEIAVRAWNRRQNEKETIR